MRSPDIKLSARSWSVCPPTSIPLVSASVAPHAKSLQCHELTERALHEERGNAFYPRLAIAASPPADGKHPRKNWPRQTSFSRSMDHASLRFRHHKKSPGLHRIPPVEFILRELCRRVFVARVQTRCTRCSADLPSSSRLWVWRCWS